MSNDCPVCFEKITCKDTLTCGHTVHRQCIINSGKAVCPICRCRLAQFDDLVIEIPQEESEWSILDKLVALGWLKHTDIPIIDELGLSGKSDLLLVKAAVLLYTIKNVIRGSLTSD